MLKDIIKTKKVGGGSIDKSLQEILSLTKLTVIQSIKDTVLLQVGDKMFTVSQIYLRFLFRGAS